MLTILEQDALTTEALNEPSGGSDARLVDAARRGDQAAYGELVQRYEQRLCRVIYRFTRDFETSEDLAQETFLKIYDRLDQFDTSRRFGPWLFRIGVNLTLDYLRRKKRRGRWSLFTDRYKDKAPDPSVTDPRSALDLQQEVQVVLQMIPEKYRTVLVLRDLENFSTAEIAAILHRKEATIRWRLAEARHRFQFYWGKRHGTVMPNNSIPPENRKPDNAL
ncbi:MAG: RNA polymerase sigma factor [Planctomycetia bacterium]|nr:RNA polymerase sigma factor [Planctomycetia bacterium]